MSTATKLPSGDRSSFNLLDETESVEAVLEQVLTAPAEENPFHLLDLDDVVRKHLNWLRELPRVKPFYAVKCNDDESIVKTLALLGTGFDCASKGEISQVLGLGVGAERIIYAHPIKAKESLVFARNNGVGKMTFDNECELEKVAKYYPEAELVLRIRHDSDKVLISLGKKFGCDARLDGPELIRKAKELGLNVIGVSFHVGCGSLDADCFYNAIKSAKFLFEFADTVGYRFSLLDIGGGFPGDVDKPIGEFATAINRALDEFFPNLDGIQVIAEPGRYYVGSAVRLLATINGKKIIRDPANSSRILQVMYYINDGVFGTLFDWVSLRAINDLSRAIPIITKQKREKVQFKTTVWGPTCDSTDIVCEDVDFPEHDIGEYLLFENIGAYGITFATNFNGFPKPTIQIYVKKQTWNALAALDGIKWQDKTFNFLQSKLQNKPE
ncbi:hypothetical protein quinque_007043 [Culex quinquefasciatus]